MIMSDSRFPILDSTGEQKPCGPGQTEVCQRCVEHLKHDYDHLIADKVERMCLPVGVMDDELHDLLVLRRGQHKSQ